jgi:hypothetical protein
MCVPRPWICSKSVINKNRRRTPKSHYSRQPCGCRRQILDACDPFSDLFRTQGEFDKVNFSEVPRAALTNGQSEKTCAFCLPIFVVKYTMCNTRNS